MRKYIRALKWLIKNQSSLESLLKNPEKKKDELRYSLAGVPKNQLKDIDDILKNDEVK